MSNENKSGNNLESFGYKQSLKRVMPLGSLVLFGLAYMAPGTIFGTYGLVTEMTHGMLALTYIVATIAMVFTAFSYNQMVKAYPLAGSVYSYVQRSINPHAGFISGWAILMDYLLIPMLNYLIISIFMRPVFPDIPGWAWVVTVIIIVTIVNFLGIQVTAWANNVLVIAQFVFVIACLLFVFKWLSQGFGAATFFDFSAIYNSFEFQNNGMSWSLILTGASILALSFLGFDAVTTVAEEAIEPQKNVGRAILIICIGAGVYFTIVAYFFQLAWPTGWQEFADVETGSYELIEMVGGTIMGYLFVAITIVGCTASAIASQSSAARILFGMGRDGVLPKKFFGYVHPRFKTPSLNIFLIGGIGFVAIVLSLDVAISLVNFGALAGFGMVNISVIFHYYIRGKQRSGKSILIHLILPILGAVVCFTIWANLAADAKILGFIWLAVGVVYLAITTNFFRKLPVDLKLEE
ncbi:MAG: APC family permease [Clostridiales bacterium]|nr:APC family permease [Clostridiales bacterium]